MQKIIPAPGRQTPLPARRPRPTLFLVTGLALVSALLCLVRLVGGAGGQPQTASGEAPGTQAAVYRGELSSSDTGESQELTAAQKLTYIQNHGELYPQQLQDLAVKNQETIDYVYQYPQEREEADIDLTAEAASGEIPLLLQWDRRWGYADYGSGLMGYTGCGPTCLSMVALYLTGDAAVTPLAVARYAYDNGYYVSGSGTAWTLMAEGCQAFGLSSREVGLDEAQMAALLGQGKPLICALGPGDFTDSGHFIVLTGYSDGSFTVNDPNSPSRSAQRWSFERLSGQIRNIWVFSRLA